MNPLSKIVDLPSFLSEGRVRMDAEMIKFIRSNYNLEHDDGLNLLVIKLAPNTADMITYRILGEEFIFHVSEVRNVGLLYTSKSKFLEFVNRTKLFVDSVKDKSEMLFIKDPEVFLSDSLSCIDKLSACLGCEKKDLDYRLKSLKIVDDRLNSKRVESNDWLQAVLPCLIFYVGETIIKEEEGGGNWNFILDEEKGYWEPNVQYPSLGLELNPFWGIIKDFYGGRDFRISIHAKASILGKRMNISF